MSDTEKSASVAYGAADDTNAEKPKRVSALIGPDGKIIASYEPVVPAEHPDQVLADLANAG